MTKEIKDYPIGAIVEWIDSLSKSGGARGEITDSNDCLNEIKIKWDNNPQYILTYDRITISQYVKVISYPKPKMPEMSR